jgi:hypothetical protein
MAEDWETKTRILFRKREEPGMAEEQEVSSEESRNHQKTEEAGSGGRHRTRELLQEEMGAAVRPREIDANITFAFSRLGSLTGERSIRLTSAPNSGTLVVPCQAPHLATEAIRYDETRGGQASSRSATWPQRVVVALTSDGSQPTVISCVPQANQRYPKLLLDDHWTASLGYSARELPFFWRYL